MPIQRSIYPYALSIGLAAASVHAGVNYIGSATTGDEPNAITVSPNGDVWVANRSGNSVSRLGLGLTPLGTITGASIVSPTSIAAFSGGNVAVASPSSGGALIRSDGVVASALFTQYGPIYDLSAAGDGSSYWTNGTASSVSRVRGDNGIGTAVDATNTGTTSTGVVAASASGEFAVYGYSNQLRFFFATPTTTGSLTNSGVFLNYANPVTVPSAVTDVAMTGTTVYATNGDLLTRLSYGETTATSVSVGGGSQSTSLDISGSGRVYVLASGLGQVKVYDTNLNLLNTFGSGLGSGSGQISSTARGIEVTSLGNIYVADRGNDRVVRFFDPAEWTAAGINTFADLDLGQDSLALTTGKNVVATGTLTLGGGSTLTINGGSASVGSVAGTGTVRHLDGTFTATGPSVAARYIGGHGASLAASGNLSIGLASRVDGFQTAGELHVGGNSVSLQDANRASLGLLTTIAGGTLTAANGLFVDYDGNVTGTGTVSTPDQLAKAIVMNGAVVGSSLANPLTFSGYIKGTGTFENVVFAGTYAPGLSPARTFATNVLLASSAVLEMELGGTTAGSEYDVVDITGTFGLDGTLNIELIDGFVPLAGDAFDLFDGSTFGAFDAIQLQALSDASLTWDTSGLYTTGIVSVVAVPEPVSLATMSLGCIALLRRRR